MKTIKYTIGLIFFIALLAGCEKELMSYEGEEGVYFAVRWGTYSDSTEWAYQFYTPVEFIKTTANELTARLRVMITGPVKEYDRTFGIALVADSTTAVQGLNYDQLPTEGVIKAGETYTDVQVTVKRAENIQQEFKVLTLALVPSEYFTLSMPVWRRLAETAPSSERNVFDAWQHQIRMSDFLSKPPRWIGNANTGREAGLWGDYTEKKFRLICRELDLTYSDFENADVMPTARQRVINQYMVKYLQQRYDDNDPVLEDDGRLMWFSGVTWTSVVGVPWKPITE